MTPNKDQGPKPNPEAADEAKPAFHFPRTLALTSPRMRDGDIEGVEDVTKAQRILADNKFGKGDPPEGGDFYHPREPQNNDEPGFFGANTGAACSLARYWLGYPSRGANSWKRRRFDERMAKRLRGDRKLRPLFRARRHRRIKASQDSLGKKALAFARKQIGEHEVPDGSNRCPTTAYWGFVGAWCLMFISRCYIAAGSKRFRKGSLYAYNPTLYHAVKGGRDGMQFVSLEKAQPGDIVQFDWNNGTEPPDHAALFLDVEGSNVVTLDGNWDDRVGINRHPKSAVMSVIRVLE